jgi:hypothetical protein
MDAYRYQNHTPNREMDAYRCLQAVVVVGLGVLGGACSVPAEPRSAPVSTLPVSWLRVAPEQGARNSVVSLDVACLDGLGVVQSPVLDIGTLKGDPEGHQPWHLFGTAIVRPDAAPGRYRVSTTCGAGELSTDFTVVAAPSR